MAEQFERLMNVLHEQGPSWPLTARPTTPTGRPRVGYRRRDLAARDVLEDPRNGSRDRRNESCSRSLGL